MGCASTTSGGRGRARAGPTVPGPSSASTACAARRGPGTARRPCSPCGRRCTPSTCGATAAARGRPTATTRPPPWRPTSPPSSTSSASGRSTWWACRGAGLVGATLAASRPDLVHRLVMVDVPPVFGQAVDDVPPRPGSFATLDEVIAFEAAANAHAPADQIAVLASGSVRPGAAGLERCHDPYFLGEWPFRGEDHWPAVRGVTCPALLVRAENSFVLSEELASPRPTRSARRWWRSGRAATSCPSTSPPSSPTPSSPSSPEPLLRPALLPAHGGSIGAAWRRPTRATLGDRRSTWLDRGRWRGSKRATCGGRTGAVGCGRVTPDHS